MFENSRLKINVSFIVEWLYHIKTLQMFISVDGVDRYFGPFLQLEFPTLIGLIATY